MSVFKACLAVCGLTQAQAAEVLSQSVSLVEKKASGSRSMTDADVEQLGEVYRQIHFEPVDSLPEERRYAALAVRLMRGDAYLSDVAVVREES